MYKIKCAPFTGAVQTVDTHSNIRSAAAAERADDAAGAGHAALLAAQLLRGPRDPLRSRLHILIEEQPGATELYKSTFTTESSPVDISEVGERVADPLFKGRWT